MIYFGLLILCHIIGDFYLQTWKIAKCKNAIIDTICGDCKKCKENQRVRIPALTFHILLYTMPFFVTFLILSWYNAILFIVVIFTTHWIIDLVSCIFKTSSTKKILIFLIDQVIHLIVIYTLYMLLEFNETFVLDYRDVIIGSAIILTLVSPPMIMIDLLFSDIFGVIEPLDRKRFDVGMIIGMFERIIVLLLVLLNSITAIAIVITVKTWARSYDIKDDREFGNKYLVGTLASISVALIAAYLWVLLIG